MKNIDFKEMGKAFLIIILYLIIVPEIISIVFYTFFKSLRDNSTAIMIINTLIYVIDLIIILFIYRKSVKDEFKKYIDNFKSFFKTAFKCWGKGFLLMIICNLILIQIVGSIASNEQTNREIMQQLPLFSVLTMVFFGPIVEEFAFRKGFKKVFKKPQTFLIFTALLFGMMHIINSIDYTSTASLLASWKQLLYIIPYSILGYYFAKAYLDTDCIFTSITCHMLHNGLSILLIFLAQLLI